MIVVDTNIDWLGRESKDFNLSGGTPITVSGQTVGNIYVLTSGVMSMGRGHMAGRMSQTIPSVTSVGDDFLDQVNNSLWKVGLISAAVALAIGLILVWPSGVAITV